MINRSPIWRIVRAGISAPGAPLLPGIVLSLFAVLFAFVGHHDWTPRGRMIRSVPGVVDGDEPQYLAVVNSLLLDGDIDVKNNFERARQGGLDLGRDYAGKEGYHHTLVVPKGAHRSVRWSPDLDLAELQHGSPLAEISSHPIGFPALVAALLWPFHFAPDKIERRSIQAVMVLAWLALVSTYLAARRSGLPTSAAIAAVVLLGLCSPFLGYCRSFFPELPLALAMVLALWAMTAGRYGLAALAVCAAIWLKPSFGLVGIAWAAERWWAGHRRASFLICGISLLGGLAYVGMSEAIAHRLLIASSLDWLFARGFDGVTLRLFDKHEGLVPFVLWAPLLLIGLWPGGRERTPVANSPFLRQIAIPTSAHFVVLCLNGYGAGHGYGPRYWIPLLPWFALAAVHLAQDHGRIFRAALISLAAVTALLAVSAALRYRFMFYEPPARALQIAHPLRFDVLRLAADYEPQTRNLTARPDQALILPVRVVNHSTLTLMAGEAVWEEPWMSLSYHLLDAGGHLLQHDNPRAPLHQPIAPGAMESVELGIRAPSKRGRYRLAVDIVWEGVCWFESRGNVPALVDLEVQ